ncbi:MAG: phenylalanine--tRNA ligase subunit alpha, partial [Caldilineaceae bacterium]|nr:phenylalanine--tRNA ligase subunit alpha [Caldilineaceae bacterium]
QPSQQPLSPHESALLLAFDGQDEAVALPEVATRSDLTVAQARSAIERLKLRGAVEQTAEWVETDVTLSEFGQTCRVHQIPELRLVAALQTGASLAIPVLQNRDDLARAESGAAFGMLRRSGLITIADGQARLAAGADLSELQARQQLVEQIGAAGGCNLTALAAADQARLDEPRLRQLFLRTETKVRSYRLTVVGQSLREQAATAKEEISRLTPAMLQDGSWRGKRFRPYNIGLPPRLVAGYRNPYRRFLDKTKQTLLALGFTEMRGSLVENEFWNMDALFMPQFHPAREIHDVYFVEEPTHAQSIAEPYLSNVAAEHEGRSDSGSRGWGYLFDKRRTHRLVLRSQGTALSVRQLGQQPKIPGKYFSMARCFRYDTVDATHAPDFIQIEGIVLSEEMTLRHLLGMLMLFAREVAQATEVRAVPAYFPFTEPSVEVHMRHPTLGWIELGGSGIFRPEVTKPFGIDVPVIAWGLGLDRMAMMALGRNDIRHLFTNNLPNGLADNRSV